MLARVGLENLVAQGIEFLLAGHDYIAEVNINLHAYFGAFQASHKIDADALVFLLFLNSRDSEGLRVENQSVVLNGLTHDFSE